MRKRMMIALCGTCGMLSLGAWGLLYTLPSSAASPPPEFSYAIIHGMTGSSYLEKGAIDVAHLEFKSSTESADVGAAGKSVLAPITFVKDYDRATTQLLTALTQGKLITGDFYYARIMSGGDRPVVYFQLQFSGVVVGDQMTDVGEQIAIRPDAEKVVYNNNSTGSLSDGLPEVAAAGALPLVGVTSIGVISILRTKRANVKRKSHGGIDN